MAYVWDTELLEEINQRQKVNALHETDFLKGYVKTQASHTYLATPNLEDYLTVSLREGTNKSIYGSNPSESASYGRTGTYDLASKLGLYNPVTSYSPPRNLYHKDQYQ